MSRLLKRKLEELKKKRMRVTFNIKKPPKKGVWLPIATSNNHQRIFSTHFNVKPTRIFKTKHGDRYAFFRNLPEKAKVSQEIVFKPRLIKKKSRVESFHLQAEKWIESNNPLIRKTAREIVGKEKNPTKKARLINEWIKKNITYKEYEGDGALDTLRRKIGDCGGQSWLFMSLLRAARVPTRWNAGIWAVEGKNQYHVYPEFHDGRKWRDADPAAEKVFKEKLFKKPHRDMVVFSKEMNIKLKPLNESVEFFQIGEIEGKKGNIDIETKFLRKRRKR